MDLLQSAIDYKYIQAHMPKRNYITLCHCDTTVYFASCIMQFPFMSTCYMEQSFIAV